MSAKASTSGSGATGELTSSPKKVPRYFNPYKPEPAVKPRAYASQVVSSQQTMLENLRFTRRQLEREDRQINILRQQLFLDQYPRKWTNYRHQMGDNKDDDEVEWAA